MEIAWQVEIGLAEIDERIADADRNISQLGSLIPELADKGYATADIEGDLLLMTKALHGLRAQRRTIVDTLDGDEPPPRIARPMAGPSRRDDACDIGCRLRQPRQRLARNLCATAATMSPVVPGGLHGKFLERSPDQGHGTLL